MKHSDEFEKLTEESKSRIQEVNAEKVIEMLENHNDFLLIDVREDSEWVAGHLPQAVHLSKGIIERDIHKIVKDKKKKLVLYCGGGFRSALAADNLQKMGYCNVFSLAGGVRRWHQLDYPLIGE